MILTATVFVAVVILFAVARKLAGNTA
jgi:hypothetical protein